MARPTTPDVCLVTCADSDEALRWGWETDRIAVPLILFCHPAAARAFRERGVSSAVRIVVTDRPPPLTPADKLDRLLAAGRHAPRGIEHCYWVDLGLLFRHLSFEFLYSDIIIRALRRFGTAAAYFPMPGYDASSCFGGPRRILEALHEAGRPPASSWFETGPAAAGPPPAFAAAFGLGPAVDLNLPLAAVIEDPILHVVGDSHVLSCFTPSRAIGCRPNVLLRTPDLSDLPVPYRYQFTHHLGGRTMHHAGQPGALLAAATAVRVKETDAVVWVFGEIDVRSHIVRQQREAGRALEEVIDTLVQGYGRSLAEVAQAYPRVRHIVFAPIPPLDNPHYSSVDLPVHGSIEERIAATGALRAALQALCDRRAIALLDVSEHFATPRGDLRWELSDHFCHVGGAYQGPIVQQLYRLLAR